MGIETVYLKFRKAVSLFFLSKLHKNDIVLNLSEPLVSFTFDDIPKSAVTNGERILRRYNYSGTYYLSIEFMQMNGFDFDGADSRVMQQIINGGGELACHTYSHLHFFKSSRKEIISDIEKNQQFIEKCVAGYRMENFSYPFGEQTSAARAVIRKRFRSGRSIYKGVNNNKVDLNCLKSIRLYESTSQEEIVSIIDTAIRKNGWIIFYTHDVAENPSKEGCSPGHFEAVVRHCFEKKLKVLPVNKVLEIIEK